MGWTQKTLSPSDAPPDDPALATTSFAPGGTRTGLAREQLNEVKLSWKAVKNGISERHIMFQAGIWIVFYIQETASEVFVAGLAFWASHKSPSVCPRDRLLMLIKTGWGHSKSAIGGFPNELSSHLRHRSLSQNIRVNVVLGFARSLLSPVDDFGAGGHRHA